MAEFDRVVRGRTATAAQAAEIDQGLRAHMSKVYGYMAGGVALTGVTAWLVANTPALVNAIYGTPLRWLVMFAPLIFVFILAARVHKMSVGAAQAAFWAFAAVMGVSLSYILLAFTGMQIAQAFFAAAIAFLAMSLYGYTTNKSLAGWGTFLFMGVIGLIVLSIINIFIGSSAISFAVSAAAVLVFAGLTAYDTQRIKNEYLYFAQAGAEGAMWLAKGAIMGALGLYLNFINMFTALLHLDALLGD